MNRWNGTRPSHKVNAKLGSYIRDCITYPRLDEILFIPNLHIDSTHLNITSNNHRERVVVIISTSISLYSRILLKLEIKMEDDVVVW